MRNPSDFYDAIAKRQMEIIQRRHEEHKMKARLAAMGYGKETLAPEEACIIWWML